MIHWYEPTRGQKSDWRLRLRGLPKELQPLAEKYPPWRLYKVAELGYKVFVSAIVETGQVRVTALTGLNPALAVDESFVLDVSELEECDSSDLPQTKPENDQP